MYNTMLAQGGLRSSCISIPPCKKVIRRMEKGSCSLICFSFLLKTTVLLSSFQLYSHLSPPFKLWTEFYDGVL